MIAPPRPPERVFIGSLSVVEGSIFLESPGSLSAVEGSSSQPHPPRIAPAILVAKVMRLSASKMTIAFAPGSLSVVEGPAIKQNTPSATSTSLSSPVYHLSNPGSVSAVEPSASLKNPPRIAFGNS